MKSSQIRLVEEQVRFLASCTHKLAVSPGGCAASHSPGVQRTAELPSCLVVFLQLPWWICSLDREVLWHVPGHQKHQHYLPKGQCVCCCHFPFCWQVRSCRQSSHRAVSRSCPSEHMENIDIKEDLLRAFAKHSCSYKITSLSSSLASLAWHILVYWGAVL